MAAEMLPTGAGVAAGSVSVGTSGTTMTVTQGSDRAVVNWSGFSVGAGHTVNFVQPNTSSAILNRVTGSATSTIAGTISANGQVYLVNPNGIAITSTGTVKVGGGFVASTLDISNEDFLGGNLTFNGNGASAGVSNEGIVTVGRGGYAALIGGTVKNDGLIAVPMGKAGLGSGEKATLDLSGDGFLQVAVPTVDGAEGKSALVENKGTISADGGTVVMKAATAREAARQAINLSGVVEAKTVSGKDGAIVIGGGDGGEVRVSGKARATAAKGQDKNKGGSVTVTGKSVKLAGAQIDASGDAGGGSVKIGGGWQGAGGTQRAKTTSVDKGTVIRADATKKGDGGTIVVWSDDLTTFQGLITARGAGTGNGGDAEVSGKAQLAYTGMTDLSAAHGRFGTLLLDPYNLTISNAATSGVSGFSATADDSVLNATTLTNALAMANVALSTGLGGSQAGNIAVAAPVAWSANTTLTLAAAGNIAFNAPVTATGASAGLVIQYGAGKNYTVNAPITLSGANATLQIGDTGALQSYTLIHNMAALDAIDTTGLSGHYALARSLDASGTTYTGALVGTQASPFTGTFAGLGNAISNLTINASSSYMGLFGNAGTGSTIREVGLLAANVNGGTGSAVGALVGGNAGTVIRSYATGNVSARITLGGLVGYNVGGTVTQSYAAVTVNGSAGVVGGLVGRSDGGLITQSHATGTVTVQGTSAGGLVGFALSGTQVTQSYATGAVSATGSDVGGLIGFNTGSSTTQSYATGRVTGSTNVGGLIGTNNAGSMADSYFDIDTTGQLSGVGFGSATGATGIHTTAAVTAGTYAGLDFANTWFMIEGGTRPFLRSEWSPTITNVHQLQLMAMDLSASYTLGANIDLSDTQQAAQMWNSAAGFSPIGSPADRFTGTFDGAGHTIANLYINSSSTSTGIGLFGAVDTGSIVRNVGLVGGSVTATNASAAGSLVGASFGTIENSYATTAVRGASFVGGLVGINEGGSLISTAYAAGNVTATGSYAGGLVGYNGGSVEFAYSTGAVSGSTNVGGFTGENDGLIAQAYATGAVAGNSNVGGFVGLNVDDISGSYWDKQTTGQLQGIGRQVAGATGVIGLTTSAFQDTASFMNAAAGWDFDTTWAPPSGGYYPVLYALTPVAWIKAVGSASTYGDSTAAVTSVTTKVGPAAYLFGPSGDGLDLNGGTVAVDPTTNAGLHTADLTAQNTIATSAGGVNYRVFYYGEDGNSLTVNRAALTVTAGNATKTYGQTAALTGFDAIGLVNGDAVDSVTLTSAGAAATASVGGSAYAIVASNATGSAFDAGNYNITYVNGALTVNKAALTVTAGNATKTYGQTAVLSSFDATGLVNGETIGSVILASAGTGATASVAGGPYTITATSATGGIFDAGNYDITYADGALTLNEAALTVTTNGASKAYDGLAWSGGNGVSYSGFVNGEGVSVLGGTLAYGGTAQGAVNAGSYGIAASGLASGNYDITYVSGALTVNKAALTVTAGNATKTYDGAAWSGNNGVSYSGFVNGEGVSVLGGTLAYGGMAQGAVNAGSYGIAASGLASGNYDITYVNGALTVNKAALTVTANDASKTYDGRGWSGGNGVSYSGFVGGDDASDLDGTLAYGGTAQGAVDAGSYGITASGLASGNYDIAYVEGALTVNAAATTPVQSNPSAAIILPPPALPIWSSPVGQMTVSYVPPASGEGQSSMLVEDIQLSGALCVLGENTVICSAN